MNDNIKVKDPKKLSDLNENENINDDDLVPVGNEGTDTIRRIKFSNIITGIKDRLVDWTYSALSTTAKTLVGAINELYSDLSTNLSTKVSKSGDTMTGRLTINTTSNAGVLYTNTSSTSSSTDTKIQATSWSGDSVWLGVGSGGTNRGVYDATASGWLVHADSSNNTYLGTTTIGNSHTPIYLSNGKPTAVNAITYGHNGTAVNSDRNIYELGGFVFINGVWGKTISTYANYTIPSGYRPYHHEAFPIVVRDGNSHFYFGVWGIESDGSSTFYYYASDGSSASTPSSSWTFYGNIIYCASM